MKIVHYNNEMTIGGVQELIGLIQKYSKHKIIVLCNENGIIGDEIKARGGLITNDYGILDQADIVHTHTCGNDTNKVIKICEQLVIPFIETIHSPQPSITGADRITCVAKFYQLANYRYIPPMIEIDKYKKSNGDAIGRIGRLVQEKRFEDFIQVADRLPQYKFLLAGVPEINNKYYWGWTRTPWEFYQKLKVFLYPTLDEACPMAIVGAMASKIPVITYDLPAARELLGGNGILVNYGDIDQLTKMTIEVYEHPEKYKDMVDRAYRIAQKYDVKKVIKQYDDLYESLK